RFGLGSPLTPKSACEMLCLVRNPDRVVNASTWSQVCQQRASFHEIACFQALAEPAVDRHKSVARLLPHAACRLKSGARNARAKLGQPCSLGRGNFNRSLELRVRLIFGLRPGCEQQQFTA